MGWNDPIWATLYPTKGPAGAGPTGADPTGAGPSAVSGAFNPAAPTTEPDFAHTGVPHYLDLVAAEARANPQPSPLSAAPGLSIGGPGGLI